MGKSPNLIVVVFRRGAESRQAITQLQQQIDPATTVIVHTREAAVQARWVQYHVHAAQLYRTSAFANQDGVAGKLPLLFSSIPPMITTIVVVTDEEYRAKAFAKTGCTISCIVATRHKAAAIPMRAAS